jgi:uncharacterized protein YjdB
MARIRHVVTGAAIAFAVLACKESTPPEAVASLDGLPTSDSITIGAKRTYPIRVFDANGNALQGRRVDYASSNPQFATVSGDGEITGIASGTTNVSAAAGGKKITMSLLVHPAVATVIVTPSNSDLPQGTSRPLTVAVNDNQGRTIAGRRLTFSSSNTAIATVNADGVVSGVALGTVTITATAALDNVSGTATVRVVPVSVASVSISPPGPQTMNMGTPLQLQAVTRDGNGIILSGRQINWSSSNSLIASVSGAGLVTGVALGTTQITAESEGRTATTQVTVLPKTLATISLGPNPATVRVGSQIQMTPDLRDEGGNQLTLDGRTVSWSSSNQPVASVNAGGVVAGVNTGAAVITVTVDGKSAAANVTVTP